MRILIVEDEKLTRDGIYKGIDWLKLGIGEVVLADDGIAALEKTAHFTPDIVLTDVRMPRMDGLQMAGKMQESFPDLVIVIMSGFSDREYLKAAIRLKAVSFVEKPIDLEELEEELGRAVQSVREKQERRAYASFSHHREAAGLALRLLEPQPDRGILKQLPLPESGPDPHMCMTMLAACYGAEEHFSDKSTVETLVGLAAQSFHLDLIHAARPDRLHLFHLFGSRMLPDYRIEELAVRTGELLAEAGYRFHLVLGLQVSAVGELHTSYESAAVGLQRVFFRKENSFYICSDTKETEKQQFDVLSALPAETAFQTAVVSGNRHEAQTALDELLSELPLRDNILPGQVKDLYYRMLSFLQKNGAPNRMRDPVFSGNINLVDLVASGSSIYELHGILEEAVRRFFDSREAQAGQTDTVRMIEYYIQTRYADRDLSVKAVSDYVHLSPSYLCTLYKSETGRTLNQYITEYRMQKARELLADPRNKVSEIAESVGFTDGNYFSKAFKKRFGYSPSDFRSKIEGSVQ